MDGSPLDSGIEFDFSSVLDSADFTTEELDDQLLGFYPDYHKLKSRIVNFEWSVITYFMRCEMMFTPSNCDCIFASLCLFLFCHW